MSKIFKPRRGKASTMNGTKSSTVLAAGEMFIELPDTGVGTGTCKMKMGDGVTAYGSLPYAMGGDIATTEITGGINDDTSSTATAALANVTTGKTLGSIIGSLRRACSLNAEAIATLNDDLKSNYLIYNTIDIKSVGTFIEHEEIVTMDLISGYKPIAIAGWHAKTDSKIFLFNLFISIDSSNSYFIDLGWKTSNGTKITNNIVRVTVLHRRSN